ATIKGVETGAFPIWVLVVSSPGRGPGGGGGVDPPIWSVLWGGGWVSRAAAGRAPLLVAAPTAVGAMRCVPGGDPRRPRVRRRAGPHGSSRGRDLCRAWARGGGDRRQEAVGVASGGLPRGALAAATMIGIPSTSPRHVSEITIPSARATHRAHGERRATPTIA